MKFTRRGECALLGILFLIKQGKDNISYVGEISQALDLPQKLMAQVFYRLARSGLLKSHRGRGGGFTIALPPEKITVKDVIEVVQGEPVIYKCVAEGASCDKYEKCSIQDMLNRIQTQVMDTLGSVTLDELADNMVFK